MSGARNRRSLRLSETAPKHSPAWGAVVCGVPRARSEHLPARNTSPCPIASGEDNASIPSPQTGASLGIRAAKEARGDRPFSRAGVQHRDLPVPQQHPLGSGTPRRGALGAGRCERDAVCDGSRASTAHSPGSACCSRRCHCSLRSGYSRSLTASNLLLQQRAAAWPDPAQMHQELHTSSCARPRGEEHPLCATPRSQHPSAPAAPSLSPPQGTRTLQAPLPPTSIFCFPASKKAELTLGALGCSCCPSVPQFPQLRSLAGSSRDPTPSTSSPQDPTQPYLPSLSSHQAPPPPPPHRANMIGIPLTNRAN